MLNLIEFVHDLVRLMEKMEVLEDFKQWASLDPNCSNETVVLHLLEQVLKIETERGKIIAEAKRTAPETLNVVFGEAAQSFEKSIFANTPNVNLRNSFLNSGHMQEINPAHMPEDSIPERLCKEFDTIIFDIYAVPIPTRILTLIKSEMRRTGLIDRILQRQILYIHELIRTVNPTTVRFICRYKSLLPDCACIVDRMLRSTQANIEFNANEALSGYRGRMDLQKWNKFIQSGTNLN